MTNFKYVLFFSLGVLLTYSCSKDKGNYDYTKMPQVDVSGISTDGYSTVYLKDVLHVEPVVVSEEPAAKYEYLWTVNKDNSLTGSFDYRIDTIGREKVLNYLVAIKPGMYNLTLRITNTSTQLQVFKTTKLEITTLFSRAFYLLKDMGTYSELDAHLPNGTVLPDLIEKSLQSKLQGKPVSLSMIYLYGFINLKTGANENGNALGVCTDNNMHIFKTADMSLIYDHSQMFFGTVPVEKPLFMYPNLTAVGYLSDKGHYKSAQNSGAKASGKFGFPDLVDGKPISANINSCYDFGFFFFDDLYGRFLCVNVNNIVAGYSGDNKPNLPYDIKHKLIFFGRNKIANDSRGYAVFIDKDDPTKRYLYFLKLTTGSLANPIQEVRVIDPASNFNRARLIASNETQARVLYFVTPENKMYMYDPATNEETPITLEGVDPDEEITYIRQRYWTATADLANNFNNVIIATYKNGRYKVCFYETLGGKPSGMPKRILQGEGRVTQFQYAAPSMTSFSYPNYLNSF